MENSDEFKCFKYKAKLLGNTIAQFAPNQSNESLENTVIADEALCFICPR